VKESFNPKETYR